jgi:LPXTG-motif cell wall-anchored protein
MRQFYLLFKIFVFVLTGALASLNAYAQNYGLRFASHEVVQDQRTSLTLTPGADLCFKGNFELSFDVSFYPNNMIYFGYLVRVIEDNTRNYDLAYNTRFNLIVGDKLTGVKFAMPSKQLFNNWNRITMKFDVDNDRISISTGDRTYTEKNVHLKKNGCYKLIFGINNFKPFETTDMPPMKIRHIQISQKGKLKYHWPLDETSGNIAHEVIQHKDGVVNHPAWLAEAHFKWQPAKQLKIDGMASVAFDTDKDLLYVAGRKAFYTFDINKNTWTAYPLADSLILNKGNQSVYNHMDGDLYNFFADQQKVSRYNFDGHNWDSNYTRVWETVFWHLNKMVSASDSSLYLFGGYGHLLYRNTVQQYHFNTKKWEQVKYKGDFFMPRYLAALGATSKSDTAYILGGYGSQSGDQIVNPRNIYDMMRYTVKDRTFKKMFELDAGKDDFALANSLVIDEKEQVYYGLIFPRQKYNSSLQLIRGSLKDPSFTVTGTAIPYNFRDVQSFADLFYSPKSKKFIAVTLLRTGGVKNGNESLVNVYTLLGPPYQAPVNAVVPVSNNRAYLWLIAAVALLGGAGWYLLKRKKRVENEPVPAITPAALVQQPIVVPEKTVIAITPSSVEEEEETVEQHHKNAILLFGDLQVFDAAGEEITKYFTPLVKEMFLYILLSTLRMGRGVSSEKLDEMFWFDKPEKSARNNRSVNIARLKSLLDRLDHCQLSKQSGSWMMDINFEHTYVDYHSYLAIVKRKKV